MRRHPRTRPARRARLTAVAAVGLTALLGACTSAGPAPSASSAITDSADHAPTTITVWSFHKLPNEVAAFRKSFEDLKRTYPWLTVNFVPNKDDAAFAKAVAARTPPDVFISESPDNVGKFCNDGTVTDMNAFLTSAKVDMATTFPAAILGYTRYGTKQCALPLLTDVMTLFYNKKQFAEAGIAGPPRTLSELTADAKKLTVRSGDGTVTRFGFMPRSDYNLNVALYGGIYSGSAFYDAQGRSTLGSDPKWADLLRWDRDLVSWYGDAQVQKFVGTYNSHTDDAQNPFATGKASMELLGEWHVGELAENAPGLDYGVAAFPVLDSVASTYGGGVAAGTVMYLPAGSAHQQEAFFALQQMATDTTFLTTLADLVSNVPTTVASLQAWDKRTDPHWTPIIDVFRRTKPSTTAVSPTGTEGTAPWFTFAQSVELGKVADVPGGLTRVAAQVDAVTAEAKR